MICYTYDTPALRLIAYLFYCILIALSPLSDLDIYLFLGTNRNRVFHPPSSSFTSIVEKIGRERNLLTSPLLFFKSSRRK